MSTPLYLNPAASPADRARDLVARMRFEEKVAQLCGIWVNVEPAAGAVAPSQLSFGGQPQWSLEEAISRGIGHVTRLLGSRPVEPELGTKARNELQRRLVEGTRLGIPAMFHEECLAGGVFQGATSFPSPLALACTFDTGLVERVARCIGAELRALGVHQGLAPVADVVRDARWGRVEETFGEDTELVSAMVAAYVRGLQGAPGQGASVAATLKHFCAYSASEAGRNFAPAKVGPRELEDVFFPPFLAGLRAGALSVMPAYQEIDGEPVTASSRLLKEVLRARWGFQGFVVSDYGAITFLRTLYKVAKDPAEASALALRAGVDVELPNPVEFPVGIPAALERGLITMEDVDAAVRRVIEAKVRLGIFEHPYAPAPAAGLRAPASLEASLESAVRCVVLAHNLGLLPLDAGSVRKVAIVGPLASDRMALYGNYSFANHVVSTHFPDKADEIPGESVLEVLRAALGDERVVHAEGCPVKLPASPGQIEEATEAARSADLTIAVVGDKAGHFGIGTVGEGTDAVTLDLPGSQGELLRALRYVGRPTVVVLVCGRPYAVGELLEWCDALLVSFFPGEFGARAICDVLLGASEPEGRLPVTFPRSVGTLPRYYSHKSLAAGFPPHEQFPAVLPFGHGLSYTEFSYSDLRVEPDQLDLAGTAVVSFKLVNTGKRPGVEVPQLYVAYEHASVTRPVLELKSFTRVRLDPGEAAEIQFELPADALAFAGTELSLVVEPRPLRLAVGASASDLRLFSRLVVVGDRPRHVEARGSTRSRVRLLGRR